ncbi:MAG TPA: hypothetical protein VH325_17995 [Bryobacteraceae bacterium]|nr:hypothetical protein [Bryobacteraceae bacterium]
MNLTTNAQGTQQMVQVTTEASALETGNANLATSFTKQQIDILSSRVMVVMSKFTFWPAVR